MKTQHFDHIIILEDDQFFGNLLRFYLINHDLMNVKWYQDEDKCLQEFPNSGQCLVLIDHHLNHSNGIDMMKKIREKNIETKFVYISGQEYCNVAIHAMKEGAIEYIEKNKDALLRLGNTVKTLCKNPDADTYTLFKMNQFLSPSRGQNSIGQQAS
jgi:FixJ family two-component response regulator